MIPELPCLDFVFKQKASNTLKTFPSSSNVLLPIKQVCFIILNMNKLIQQ